MEHLKPDAQPPQRWLTRINAPLARYAIEMFQNNFLDYFQ
jgi:hypothetical protein